MWLCVQLNAELKALGKKEQREAMPPGPERLAVESVTRDLWSRSDELDQALEATKQKMIHL